MPGAKVRAPKDSRGRALKGIYVAEAYSSGTKVAWQDAEAALDYDGFLITIMPQRTERAAREWVETSADSAVQERGLGYFSEVNGLPAWVETKGEAKPIADPSREFVPFMTVTENRLCFCAGQDVIHIYSETLSVDDLFTIAESMDFD